MSDHEQEIANPVPYIEELVGRHNQGVCTHFVLLAEVMGADGDFYFTRLDDGDTRPWVYTGLLTYALEETSDSDDDE